MCNNCSRSYRQTTSFNEFLNKGRHSASGKGLAQGLTTYSRSKLHFCLNVPSGRSPSTDVQFHTKWDSNKGLVKYEGCATLSTLFCKIDQIRKGHFGKSVDPNLDDDPTPSEPRHP